MIEVKHLTKRYGGQLAVDDLSFTIEEGQVWGFLGPNGAGKSTTMNMMTGYLAPSGGEILVDGHDMGREPEAAKAAIGYLPEIPPLYPEMTVEEYLRFCAELKRVPKGERAAQVDRAVTLTHLEGVEGRLIRNLSKGYRQRVGLAQAILGSPRILILDEPTVGLDPKQIAETRSLIRELAKEHTVLLSSHILSEIREVCDRVLILSRGRLVACDTPEGLEKRLTGVGSVELILRATEEEVREIFAALPGVTALSVTAREDGTAAVSAEWETDLREELFYTCAQRRCPLLELRPKLLSLEEVFLELTEGETPPVDDETDAMAAADAAGLPTADRDEAALQADEDDGKEAGE